MFLMLLFVSMTATAQKEVTKFLGIPVDGTKSSMIQKLKAKGFKYNDRLDYLTGEFNGVSVRVYVVTNNNRVWRIMLQDLYPSSETDIKIRFNNLCRQFKKNEKYLMLSLLPEISDDEDISYKMTVENKRYEATFSQRIDLKKSEEEVRSELLKIYSKEKLDNPTEEENEEIRSKEYEIIIDKWYKRSVWFMIDGEYGRYRILMYYDNGYNRSDGEEL